MVAFNYPKSLASYARNETGLQSQDDTTGRCVAPEHIRCGKFRILNAYERQEHPNDRAGVAGRLDDNLVIGLELPGEPQ